MIYAVGGGILLFFTWTYQLLVAAKFWLVALVVIDIYSKFCGVKLYPVLLGTRTPVQPLGTEIV